MSNEILPNIKSVNKFIFCPFGSCPNIPKIYYSKNPLKYKFQFKCTCQKDKENENKMNLEEFLEKSSHLSCDICHKKSLDDKINYCQKCKSILDTCCLKIHERFCKDAKLNQNIFNYCLEHGNQYMFRCMECKKSLCCQCDLNYHNDNNHTLNQIAKLLFNQDEFDKIKKSFDIQKTNLEKIKVYIII